jgi:hypothetical protein
MASNEELISKQCRFCRDAGGAGYAANAPAARTGSLRNLNRWDYDHVG